MSGLDLAIRAVAQIFIWIVIASALLSFILPPYHSLRVALDKIVEPFLNPIRQIMPAAGGLDFSPLILILAVEFLSRILTALIH
ncbi:MAG: YggT family protein [Anaerolineales bacterium]|nr:YggT family protein [Anaerolineales bacterium]MCZ2122312.1 YggT family protein [Anaerolineales bacterium]